MLFDPAVAVLGAAPGWAILIQLSRFRTNRSKAKLPLNLHHPIGRSRASAVGPPARRWLLSPNKLRSIHAAPATLPFSPLPSNYSVFTYPLLHAGQCRPAPLAEIEPNQRRRLARRSAARGWR